MPFYLEQVLGKCARRVFHPCTRSSLCSCEESCLALDLQATLILWIDRHLETVLRHVEGRLFCRDVDSWADIAESAAKGQDRKFSRGGFSEDLSSLAGLGDFSAGGNQSFTKDIEGKQRSNLLSLGLKHGWLLPGYDHMYDEEILSHTEPFQVLHVLHRNYWGSTSAQGKRTALYLTAGSGVPNL